MNVSTSSPFAYLLNTFSFTHMKNINVLYILYIFLLFCRPKNVDKLVYVMPYEYYTEDKVKCNKFMTTSPFFLFVVYAKGNILSSFFLIKTCSVYSFIQALSKNFSHPKLKKSVQNKVFYWIIIINIKNTKKYLLSLFISFIFFSKIFLLILNVLQIALSCKLSDLLPKQVTCNIKRRENNVYIYFFNFQKE